MLNPESRVADLQDQILETEIKSAGLRIELHMAMLQLPGLEGGRKNLIRAEADHWRRQMERMLASRRPELVARMERERGLARA